VGILLSVGDKTDPRPSSPLRLPGNQLAYIILLPEIFMATETPCTRAGCTGTFEFSRHCGAYVCYECDEHKGLARCYCGWSADGGDGYRELEEMGEQIEDDY